ncbi:unnamed protein product [Protopolystoma xenopodis]|uniref:Mediator of RNA polymerase II transcription subunit 1 n=1 Tax=Protopolystoma xenopodis TaxID=117903 RepID=A0A3S5C3M3_9PLAT|nr:unnamed protein product [Protopolystoma xenopodis]
MDYNIGLPRDHSFACLTSLEEDIRLLSLCPFDSLNVDATDKDDDSPKLLDLQPSLSKYRIRPFYLPNSNTLSAKFSAEVGRGGTDDANVVDVEGKKYSQGRREDGMGIGDGIEAKAEDEDGAAIRQVNFSLLGSWRPRKGGKLGKLTYLVTPAQLAFAFPQFRHIGLPPAGISTFRNAPYAVSASLTSYGGLSCGFSARVGLQAIEELDSQVKLDPDLGPRLPSRQLVSVTRDLETDIDAIRIETVDSSDFAPTNATAVLILDPPLPIEQSCLKRIEKITGLHGSLSGSSRSTLPLSLLILQLHDQAHLYNLPTHMILPNRTHHAYCVSCNSLGCLISRLPFTASTQLPELIYLLRRQAAAIAFYETFLLHPRQPPSKGERHSPVATILFYDFSLYSLFFLIFHNRVLYIN